MQSLGKLLKASALLWVMIVALSAQGQPDQSSSLSPAPSPGNPAILCKPGLVFRCSNLGCFCVKP
ncbi:MAG TPA: hypothetical protein VKZ53_12255 [Candidatus Angelobacter sp.]|nr:hypothetical protein [Candidatus Angelobacter sp.]